MPAAVSYPGVYIEEIPSGVRTITGVATSITAFIGRARRGSTNEPVTINSFGDFERAFGGLQEEYLMSYAVRDFFLNGGSTAIVVRITHPNDDAGRDAAPKAIADAKQVRDAAAGAADPAAAKAAADGVSTTIQNDNAKSAAEKAAAKKVADEVDTAAGKAGATLDDVKKAADQALKEVEDQYQLPSTAKLQLESATAGGAPLILEAADEGEWGNTLAARVDYDGVASVGDRFKSLGAADLFNLIIRNPQTGNSERFLSVTVKPGSPRTVTDVLEHESNLMRVKSPGTKPKPTDDVLEALWQAIVDDSHATPEQKKAAQKLIDELELKKKLPFNPSDDSRYVKVIDADKGSDGGPLDPNDITEGSGLQENKRGLFALDKADLFNLLCIPADKRDDDTSNAVYQKAQAYCVTRRALLLVDPPHVWGSNKETAATTAKNGLPGLGLTGEAARNAALYFPRVIQPDPNRDGQPDTFVPCGIIAGIMARTDTSRGVWKAPAGLDAAVNGIQGLQVNLNDAENGILNPLGINCLRFFPPVGGRVIWGARTLRGADQLADEYKYVPVRRTALFLEESLYRGLQWVVFEPNDEPLWAQIRLNVGAFMQNLFRQGAFQGTTPRDAYFVKCDKETTTQNDINLGIVNIIVGFAPLKPAEFVIVKIQQMAGQIAT